MLLIASDIHFNVRKYRKNIPARSIDAFVSAADEMGRNGGGMVLLAGDFTEGGHSTEYADAGAFVERLLTTGNTVIATPGNHDLPVIGLGLDKTKNERRWERYEERILAPLRRQPGVAVCGRDMIARRGHDVVVALSSMHRSRTGDRTGDWFVRDGQVEWAAATLGEMAILPGDDLRLHFLTHVSMWSDLEDERHLKLRRHLERDLLVKFGFHTYINGHSHIFRNTPRRTVHRRHELLHIGAPTLSSAKRSLGGVRNAWVAWGEGQPRVVRAQNWAVNNLSSATAAPPAGGDPSASAGNDGQHLVFTGSGGILHHLIWSDAERAWSRREHVIPGVCETSSYHWGGRVHILCRDAAGRAHELSADRGFHPLQMDGCGITSRPWGYSFREFECVVARADDGHLHEWWYRAGDGGWNHHDLSALAGAPPCAGAPFACSWAHDDAQHVFYRDTDGSMHELRRSGNQWEHWRPGSGTGAPPAAGNPVAWAHEFKRSPKFGQHVAYRAADGHLHELYYQGDEWRHLALTAHISAPLAAGDPVAWQSPCDFCYYVVYRGVDGHLHELAFLGPNVGWEHRDLTLLTAAPPPAGDACAWRDRHGWQHLAYCDDGGQIIE